MLRPLTLGCVLALTIGYASVSAAQEKKLERLRTGGGSASATQMALWFAKEGGYYEKNGLNVEVVSIPGSSLALQAMLSGELPIIQVRPGSSWRSPSSGAPPPKAGRICSSR